MKKTRIKDIQRLRKIRTCERIARTPYKSIRWRLWDTKTIVQHNALFKKSPQIRPFGGV